MEPVTWSIVVQASEWLTRAINAAKNKDQQRFARLIEHVGTIVAGLRALDREAHRLFLPLIYGDVRTWPNEQRRQWANDLVALAHEDRITPAIRVSLAALNDLGREQRNHDVRRLVEEFTVLLNMGQRRGFSGSSLEVFVDSNVTGSFDYRIGSELDPILEALENPERSDLLAIRATAAMFVYGVTEEVQQFVRIESGGGGSVAHRFNRYQSLSILASSDVPGSPLMQEGTYATELKPSTNAITTLRPYADHAETIFGQLLGLQNRVFPSLPTPVWVWSLCIFDAAISGAKSHSKQEFRD